MINKTLLGIRMKIIGVAVIFAALTAIVVGIHTKGYNAGAASRQGEVDKLKTAEAQGRVDIGILTGKIDAMKESAVAVTDLREQLNNQAKDSKAQLDRLLISVNRPLPKTGNDCVDAKAVAKQYFQALSGETK